jgi:hypothetical protein
MTGEVKATAIKTHEGNATISLMSDGTIHFSIKMKDKDGKDVVFNKTGCRQGGMSGKVKKALGFDQVKIN